MSSETAHRSRIAVVTGSGSGIGRACALALLAAGWSLALAGRRKDALEATLDLAGPDAGRVLVVPTDICKPASVEALFETVVQHFGRLDLLFNNAGATVPRHPTADVVLEDWQRVMQTTVTGTFLCAQQAFRRMSRQSPMGGRIINNGAPSAVLPWPGAITFSTAKHAILGLTRALALDGRPYNISCGQIDLGNVEPPGGAPKPGTTSGEGPPRAEPTMPVERVTAAVLFMASLPLDSTVQYLTVLPTTRSYVDRG